ncbi:MAG: DUF721 domain-containing protein [Coriobacteriales bacterium]|nr:DUF721 domain-containing protein [Coriobacteriales bacterium]
MVNLKDGINQAIAKSASPKLKRGVRLKNAWESVATETVLAHTDNIIDSLKNAHSLVVFVDDSAWAAQLSMSKEYYRQSLQFVLNEPIEDIFFIVSKKAGIRKEFKKHAEQKPWYKDDLEPIQLTDSELEYIRKSVDRVKDEKLKEKLFEAFVADFKWKKGVNLSKQP